MRTFFKGTTLALALFQPVVSFPGNKPDLAARATSCATGVHIIVARGTLELQGEGLLGLLSSEIKSQIPGSDSEALVYPASATDYFASEAQGVANLTKAIKSYVHSCPKTKIVLLGYSQGAQVTSNTICGTDEMGATSTAPLNFNKFGKHIAAVVTYGDPTHVPGQVYDLGTSTNPGLWPRLNSAQCQPYAHSLAAYCLAGDPVCDDKGTDFLIHLQYFGTYDDAAAKFVAGRVAAAA